MVAETDFSRGDGEAAVPISVLVDADVLARLECERRSMAEPDLRTTIRRRLETSGQRLAHLERHDLLWSPPRRERRCVHAYLSEGGLARLRQQAERLDIDESLLLSGVLSDDLFASPLAILASSEEPTGYLRSERGRGRIYGMRFEVAGYQYAFMKTLSGETLTPTDILELALTNLAQRIAKGDAPAGMRLSREAVGSAAEMTVAAGRRAQLSRR